MVQLINEGSGKDKNGGVINGPITSSPSFEQLAQYSDVQVNFIEFIAAAMCKYVVVCMYLEVINQLSTNDICTR